MKQQTTLVLCLLYCLSIFSQKRDTYYQKIIDTTKNKELKLASLDSLIYDVRNQKDLKKFADRSEQYVNLAIELEMFNDAIDFGLAALYNINQGLGDNKRALKLLDKIEPLLSKTEKDKLKGRFYTKKADVLSSTKRLYKCRRKLHQSYRNLRR